MEQESQSHSQPPLEELLQKYIDSFTEKEMQAYLIAKDHLGMSFILEKCNGFLKWKAKNGYQ
jgi:hypothetical protein